MFPLRDSIAAFGIKQTLRPSPYELSNYRQRVKERKGQKKRPFISENMWFMYLYRIIDKLQNEFRVFINRESEKGKWRQREKEKSFRSV